MIEITDVIVVDWDFSTNRPCVLCDKWPKSAEYWQMAKVRIIFPGLIHQTFTELLVGKRGKWICLECLGRTVKDKTIERDIHEGDKKNG